MEIKQIRVLNIRYLAEKHGRIRIAESDPRPEKKWTDNYINQLCGDFGSFGNATARNIEKGMGLPKGWMDSIHPELTYPKVEGVSIEPDVNREKIMELWDRMDPELRARYLKIGSALVDE